MEQPQLQGTLRLYACGGAGLNIAKLFTTAPKGFKGLADVHVSAIDTSRSNLDSGFTRDQTYLIPDTDGAGKDRALLIEAIVPELPRILADHPPMDLNVVLYSASGGTGSVSGPLIGRELAQQGHQVIHVVIGTEETGDAAANTLGTLRTLENFCQIGDYPTVVHYTHHDNTTSRAEVDKAAHLVISNLAYLCSRQNAELDSQDIKHWLNFTKKQGLSPRLGLLRRYDEADELDAKERQVLSSVFLLMDPEQPKPKTYIPSGWTGYYRPGVDGARNTYMVISTDGLAEIRAHLTKIVDVLEKQKQAVQDAPSFMGNNATIDKSGIVL